MSLIHKALNKADKKPAPGMNQVQDIEEQLIVEESGLKKFEMTPRTIVLMVLVLAAAAVAIYTNFFMDKKGSVKDEALAAKKAAQQAQPAPVQPVAKPKKVVGITRSNTGGISYPVNPEARALSKEAESLFENGNLDTALLKFNEALQLAPSSPDILNSLGLVYKKKGDLITAKNYYTKAIDFGPECAECYNNLGVLEADDGNFVDAVLHFRKAIGLSQTYADPYFNLAVILEKEGNYKSAVENYKHFLVYTSTTDENLRNSIKERIEDLALNWENE